jgi:hypothetical protein
MMPKQDFISEGLQKDLDKRIATANGDISAVRRELQNELHALENQQRASGKPQDSQVQVALLLDKIRYLESLAATAHQAQDHTAPNLWQRIGAIFSHKEGE